MTTSAKTGPNVMSQAELAAELTALNKNIQNVRQEIAKRVYGNEELIEQLLSSLLAGGHALLIGLPGLAKTMLIDTVGTVLGLDSKRIQCTPDLMPADILGSEILDESSGGKREFRLIKGPVFCQMLMADEINRASPRTQSALLQAMQEKQVTIAGKNLDLPAPFFVLATQNPLEQEGTYPLPEAQLDRFLLQLTVGYPDAAVEQEILLKTTSGEQETLTQCLTVAQLQRLQQLVRELPVAERLLQAVVALVRSTRPGADAPEMVHQYINYGAGPRAGQSLLLAMKARALLGGRFAPSMDDLQQLAVPALQHRLGLNWQAAADGVTIEHIVGELVQNVVSIPA